MTESYVTIAPLQGSTVVPDLTIALGLLIMGALVAALLGALRRIAQLEDKVDTQGEEIQRMRNREP